MIQNFTFSFFGSSEFSTIALEELNKLGLVPRFVVTTPDKPQGRSLQILPNSVKTWAKEKNIKVYDPAKLDSNFAHLITGESCDVHVVASYGKIIPASVFNSAKYGTLNIHPSLLPKYRGASPIQSAMLDNDKHTGVSIMLIDEQMDHGPILAQKEFTVDEWPVYEELERQLAEFGAKLLADTMPKWVSGNVEAVGQDHNSATYTKKIIKEDACLDFNSNTLQIIGDQYEAFRKIQAYHEWPKAHFYIEKSGRKIRVKITDATFVDEKLTINKVVPEGSREMDFDSFKRGYRPTTSKATNL